LVGSERSTTFKEGIQQSCFAMVNVRY